MDQLKDKVIMVLDTEYDTSPKRLLALAYIIYKNNEKIKKQILFIKHDSSVFKVNEYGEAIKFHGLTNKFLRDNGKSLEEVFDIFYNDLEGVNILLGQNIISADLSLLRKELIGLNLWYSKYYPNLSKLIIYDTMKAFKNCHSDKSASLDNIFKFLYNEEMENHHNALYDCKNTYKCFKKMIIDNNYKFENNLMNNSDGYFSKLASSDKFCYLCNTKIFSDKNKYIINSNCVFNQDSLVCTKCFSNIEVIILKNNKFKDMVKMRYVNELTNKFFKINGSNYNVLYLTSIYKDKDEIKKLGGKWDRSKRKWYCVFKDDNQEDTIQKFSKWL
jgi:DNA polymerase III epsilon subunit-like protein